MHSTLKKIAISALAATLVLGAGQAYAGSECASKSVEKAHSCTKEAKATMVAAIKTGNWNAAAKKIDAMPAEGENGVCGYDLMKDAGLVRVEFHPGKIDQATILANLNTAGEGAFTASSAELQQTSVVVEGMTCQGCVKSVRAAVEKVPNVVLADIELETGKVVLSSLKDKNVDVAAVTKAVKKAGFTVKA